jgi:MoaA/NifB/PqqE/SkfB family radical SAM enzyme
MYSYKQIKKEMHLLYQQGIRILFFCGGETFLWNDQNKTIRDLVIEAKQMGFFIVNVVTNGTFPLDLPEADLILLSLDGNRINHNKIRGETFDFILNNIRTATSSNICLYMAINIINLDDIQAVCEIAKQEKNIRAVSFNFHTPYPRTEYLSLTRMQKEECLGKIAELIKQKYPIFNLRSAFSAIASNSFQTPCYQCVVMENGKKTICGRCVEIDKLCAQCGYFFAAEYSLLFHGNIKVGFDMLSTYLKYL